MRVKFTLIFFVAAALLVAGCGSSGSSSSSGGSSSASSGSTASGEDTTGGEGTSGANSGGSNSGPLTKKEFIKEGDAICAKIPQAYGEEATALENEAKAKKKPKPSKEETNLKAAVPPLYKAIEELEELSPPQGEEQKATAIIASLEAAAKGLEEKPESELSGPKSPYAEFQKLTKEYGFQVCSEL